VPVRRGLAVASLRVDGLGRFPVLLVLAEPLGEVHLDVSPVPKADLVPEVFERRCPESVGKVGGVKPAVHAREGFVAEGLRHGVQTERASDVYLRRPVHKPLA
jgi:hypothetical protein